MEGQTIDVARRRFLLTRNQLRCCLALLPLLTALGLVFVTTLRCPLKDDTAWLLYVTQQWLAGRQLYVDLIEVNPPMIVWILAPPTALAVALGIAPKLTIIPLFAFCMLACAGWCTHLLRSCRPLGATPLQLFAAIGTVLLAIPGPEFGQREHLLVAAALPYLCIFALNLNGARAQPLAETIAGVLAGLGCALKPQFLVAFALLELVGALNGQRPVRRLTISAATTVAAYIAAILWLEPAYFTDAIPLGIALYGASDVSWPQLVRESRAVLLGDAVAVALWWIYRRKVTDSTVPMTLAVFAAGAILVWFLEGKAWFYHRLPASIVTALALLYWVSAVLSRTAMRLREASLAGAAALIGLLGLAVAAFARWHGQVEIALAAHPLTEERIEELIRRERARSYVAFSEWLGLGFPVVNDTGVIWSSRFDSMWALQGEIWRRRIDGHMPREWPVHNWVVEDFLAGCPDLAVVDDREGIDYVRTLSAFDRRFKTAWSNYHQIAAFDGVRVFRRRPMPSSMAAMRCERPRYVSNTPKLGNSGHGDHSAGF
jgi:hypothetical protein